MAEEVVLIEQLVEAWHLAGRDEPHDERVEALRGSWALAHLPVCSQTGGDASVLRRRTWSTRCFSYFDFAV
ncbi:MAG: hypothetical protein ACYDEY_14200 [Acidimicrobiales bacterium]